MAKELERADRVARRPGEGGLDGSFPHRSAGPGSSVRAPGVDQPLCPFLPCSPVVGAAGAVWPAAGELVGRSTGARPVALTPPVAGLW